MALSTTSATIQPSAETPAAPSSSFPSSGTALLLMAAMSGAAMSKTARRQYRKMARKAAWTWLGLKMAKMLGFKRDVPDTVMGLNFWVFLLLVAVGVAIGAALFGLVGFLILLGISIIIYLLLQN